VRFAGRAFYSSAIRTTKSRGKVASNSKSRLENHRLYLRLSAFEFGKVLLALTCPVEGRNYIYVGEEKGLQDERS
jgi:hypothetical protein